MAGTSADFLVICSYELCIYITCKIIAYLLIHMNVMRKYPVEITFVSFKHSKKMVC
jgi:hypothetical protein